MRVCPGLATKLCFRGAENYAHGSYAHDTAQKQWGSELSRDPGIQLYIHLYNQVFTAAASVPVSAHLSMFTSTIKKGLLPSRYLYQGQHCSEIGSQLYF